MAKKKVIRNPFQKEVPKESPVTEPEVGLKTEKLEKGEAEGFPPIVKPE